MKALFRSFFILLAFVLAGCSTPTAQDQGGPAALAEAIMRLGPNVDPAEARRAADVAYAYPLQLREEWQVIDAPLVHNFKIAHGMREKGLCNDWTRAMLTRLGQERFRTLDLHWSTSPPRGMHVIHHSAVVSAKGDTLYDGIVLDPWRWGGDLYWAAPEDDPTYVWGPLIERRSADSSSDP